eukprot:TRINITY_DN6747_c0_g1_i1.p1 TRINITY_DN6747_c0_g1~~TRINITY_DN6747_c0_g1_i1.p1  ORF type:complete len:239 (+),score=10.67 TRINITY_DN6747_c0_g1_i1:1-717(+)
MSIIMSEDKLKNLIGLKYFNIPETSTKQGYIYKEGLVNTEFKRRYLCFEGDELAYYKTSNLREKQGVIAIRLIQSVELIDQYKGRDNIFAIRLESRTYYLQSETAPDALSWVNAITNVRDFYNSNPTYLSDISFVVDPADQSFDIDLEDILTQPPSSFEVLPTTKSQTNFRPPLPSSPSPDIVPAIKRTNTNSTTPENKSPLVPQKSESLPRKPDIVRSVNIDSNLNSSVSESKEMQD